MALVLNIIMEHKLTGDNYMEWKGNLKLVLTSEKYKFVLQDECPSANNVDAKTKLKDANDIA